MFKLVVLLAALLVAACATHAPFGWGESRIRSEREILVALRSVGVSDDQRLSVLAAYDAERPQLKQLYAERAALRDQLARLPPRSPDFHQQVDAIADRWGALHAEELRALFRFEHAVATALEPEQWRRWRAYFAEPEVFAGGSSQRSSRRHEAAALPWRAGGIRVRPP